MRKSFAAILCFALCLVMLGCSKPQTNTPAAIQSSYDGTHILLSDTGITVDGKAASANSSDAVYVANDIIYYETSKDHTYGDGCEQDAHTPEEAAAHDADPMLRGAGHGGFQPVRAVSCHQM